jgi:hypothetical protein
MNIGPATAVRRWAIGLASSANLTRTTSMGSEVGRQMPNRIRRATVSRTSPLKSDPSPRATHQGLGGRPTMAIHQAKQATYRSVLPEEIDWKPFPACPPCLSTRSSRGATRRYRAFSLGEIWNLRHPSVGRRTAGTRIRRPDGRSPPRVNMPLRLEAMCARRREAKPASFQQRRRIGRCDRT